ncbi:NAD(P)-dependent oxidoreductase [Secundilactobacillus paracollinoides]|uniref:NAD(P)-dependent oxidoreductase n=1 Tax=Secundilactobacillus paracollinoides TaxID=240427 RepID=A0A1B2IVT5_9LACO|nr:NAD(P)H-binding protein [Secundilactobacillus paracollinoides]ANZ60323.1 NAD(P)-dependent oxidoreductase [Secundilactobacillus paracollinoides]ANZ62692.1 NAD(P)-dependent oxidoreductase [Secundilactobacillus paracollinoides]ANZ66152.1 NAD(P)-dependent oxidoreductase [Secundilactobacillus paracollinoides]
MTTYAVTGATGHFGQATLQTLTQLVAPENIVALACNTKKVESLVPAGVTVRPGDYDNEAELTASLAGIDRLLFVSSQPGGPVSREQQHLNVVNAAKAAGVGYVAYTSFPHADTATSPLSADHKATEKALNDSGIAHSFLRNNWYLENELATLKDAQAGKPFVYAGGDGQVGWALEREYAEGAANVLASDSQKPVYEFSGAPLTYSQLADALSGDFAVQSLTTDDYNKGLQAAGLDEGTAGVVTMIQQLIRDGELAKTSTDLPEVLGHELTPLDAALAEVLQA